MATHKHPEAPAVPAQQPEQLPQAGGSYIRQPDGTLVPVPSHPETATEE